jgi:hypothetical protein
VVVTIRAHLLIFVDHQCPSTAAEERFTTAEDLRHQTIFALLCVLSFPSLHDCIPQITHPLHETLQNVWAHLFRHPLVVPFQALMEHVQEHCNFVQLVALHTTLMSCTPTTWLGSHVKDFFLRGKWSRGN